MGNETTTEATIEGRRFVDGVLQRRTDDEVREHTVARWGETLGVTGACLIIGCSLTTWYRRVRAGEWPDWPGQTGRNAQIPIAWVMRTAGPQRLREVAEHLDVDDEEEEAAPLGRDGVSRLDGHDAELAALASRVDKLEAENRKMGFALLEALTGSHGKIRRAKADGTPNQSL